jgi:hypothetical protein
MNAQRSVWTPPLPLLAGRVAPYAGGAWRPSSTPPTVSVWWVSEDGQRRDIRTAEIPNEVLSRTERRVLQLIACDTDARFLFARFSTIWLAGGGFRDVLDYAVVDKSASVISSGTIDLSDLRDPDSTDSLDLMHLDYSKWLWDGRILHTLFRRIVIDRQFSETRSRGDTCVSRDAPLVHYSSTIRDVHEVILVTVDTADGSRRAPQVLFSGSFNSDYSSTFIEGSETPLLLSVSTMMRSSPIDAATIDTARLVVSYRDEDISRSCDSCIPEPPRGFGSMSRSSYLAVDNQVALQDTASCSRPAERCGQDCIVDTAYWTIEDVFAAEGLPTVTLAIEQKTTGDIDYKVCRDAQVIATIPVTLEDLGWRTPQFARWSQVGMSSDIRWPGNIWFLAGDNRSVTLFCAGASLDLAREGKDWDYTTWWLFSVDLFTGRVTKELRIEPLDVYRRIEDRKIGDITYAMPMVANTSRRIRMPR